MNGDRCVLVVDDDAGIRTMLELALGTEGYRVALAASADDALRQLGAESPDVALLDVRLRGGPGLQLARRIIEEHGVPVIVMSAGDRGPAVREVPAAAFLQKPFDLAQLFELVDQAMTGRTPGAISRAHAPEERAAAAR